MTQTKHTEKPWVIEDGEDIEGNQIRALYGQQQIVHAIGKPWVKRHIATIEDATKADECLMISAPELLDALKVIRLDLENNGEVLGTDEERIKFLTKVISKAEGQS